MSLPDKKSIEDIEFTPAGAAIKIVRSAISLVMIGFMLVMASSMFSTMAETGDGIIVSFSKGMKAMLLVIFVMAAVMLIHDVVEFFIIKSGSYENGFGRMFLYFTGIIQANYSNMFMVIFGAVFAGFAASFILMGGYLTNGDKTGLIIGIVFIVAGLGVMGGGIWGLVRMVRESIKDFTLNVRN